jgi:hypothetical protein
MAVLAYFSYGISVFSLKNCGITILEILRYTVFAILDSKTAVIDKICLRYYGIEYPPMPPSDRWKDTQGFRFDIYSAVSK